MSSRLCDNTVPWRMLVGLMVVLLIGLAVGCSDDDDIVDSGDIPPAIDSIGPDGGAMTYRGEFTMIIPDGALTEMIQFEIDVNPQPPAPPAKLKMMSSAYEVGPSGTRFDQPAIISVPYNESELAGADENGLSIYTNDGTGWSLVNSTVSEAANLVTANINHLSLFGVFGDTTSPVFTAMAIGRTIYNTGGSPYYMDVISARFDSTYAPCEPVTPRQADTVRCDEYVLDWVSEASTYMYTSMTPFVEADSTYVFDVVGDADVPSMTDSIVFPALMPYVTVPDNNATVSLNGFDVVWTGTGDGTVRLVLIPTGALDSALMIDTPNDGSHSFSSADLTGIIAGEYGLLLIYENVGYIDAEGYDPRSFIRARVMNTTLINLQ